MFFPRPSKTLNAQIEHLEQHLAHENPVLVEAIQRFRQLDKMAYRLGLLDTDSSYATKVPWWPLISILGTFSAGKSTFINDYLQVKLQLSGNQAVDEKFTVICYSQDQQSRTLPGLALDADPRFPFYQISGDIEAVAAGEGGKVDRYLQLKTCHSERIRGKILIDSPGFDADEQRTSTLRITDHILDLSDLVLVFFDARHPEPGAMRDTLSHLVERVKERADMSKFIYILNQIDTSAGEDNPEEVVGAWQRAIASAGLSSGRFLCIYNEEAAVPINDPALKKRFQSKRDTDMAEIHARIQQVGVERVYRSVGGIERVINAIQSEAIPSLIAAISQWRNRVLIYDGIFIGGALMIAGWGALQLGESATQWPPAIVAVALDAPIFALVTGTVMALGLVAIHLLNRRRVAESIAAALPETGVGGNVALAFRRNTRYWRSLFQRRPVGWSARSRKKLAHLSDEVAGFVQTLNDRYTDPSGESSITTSSNLKPSLEQQIEGLNRVAGNSESKVDDLKVNS